MEGYRIVDLSRGAALAALITSPLNIHVVPGFRPGDLLLMTSVVLAACAAKKLKIKVFLMLVVTAGAVITRALFYSESNFDEQRQIFIYKYTLLVLTPVLCYHLFAAQKLDVVWVERLGRMIMAHLWFLILWAVAYTVGTSEGLLEGYWRVSFPLSENYARADSHTYSSVLGLSILAYISVLRRTLQHSKLTVVMTVTAALFALVLTGSRSGVAMLVVGVIFWQALKGRAVSQTRALFVCGLIAWVASIIAPSNELLQRAVNFDLAVDKSALGRLDKLQIGISQVWEQAPVFGVGFSDASLLWYDGFHTIVLVHWGFAGLLTTVIIVACLLAVILRRPNDPLGAKSALVALFITLILANTITEYALVTRALIPFTLCMVYVLAISKVVLARETEAKARQQQTW